MPSYVISDIHGQYDLFIEILEKIDLKDSDTLYILGDVVDRGPHPIKTLLKLMEMPNVVAIIGNHELMAARCLRFLMQNITVESLSSISDEMIEELMIWEYNGGSATADEFHKLDEESKLAVLDFLDEFSEYEEVTAGGKNYLLIHGALGNYSPDKELEDYTLDELVWERADFATQYFPDKYVVTGHTPTQTIEGNPHPGYIYRVNNHIAIDCGCFRRDGRLAAICLDTGEEFYSSDNYAGIPVEKVENAMSDTVMKTITKDCDSVAIRVKQHEIEAYIKNSGICARVEDYIDLAFIDCGRNLEKITCPLCGSNVDFDWFGEALDGCLNGDLINLSVKMPCCGKRTLLSGLEYDQPCGFGELAVIIENCDSPDQVIEDLEKIIDEKLRVIYARY